MSVPPPPPGAPVGTSFSGPSSGLPFTPLATPRRPPVLPRVLALVAVLVLVGAAVVLSVRGSGSDEVDAAALRDVLDGIVDDADLDDDQSEELRRCPLGDLDELAERAVEATSLDDAIVGGPTTQTVFPALAPYGPLVICTVAAPDEDEASSGESVSFVAVVAPRRADYADALELAFDGVGSIDGPESFRGGERWTYCVGDEDDSFRGCWADWVDPDRRIVIAFGVGGAGTTADQALEGFDAVFDEMVDALEQAGSSGDDRP